MKKQKVKKYLNVTEIASRLEVTPYTARNLIKKGEIKGIKIGTQYKVTEDNFKLFIEKSST